MSLKSEITSELKKLKLKFSISEGTETILGDKYKVYNIDLRDNLDEQYENWYDDAWKALSDIATAWGAGIDADSFVIEIAIKTN